jgi:hypothetical protein
VARLVAYGLPPAVLIVGVTDTDLWPATGWRLFSGVRQSTQATWVVEATDADGVVRRHEPGALGNERREWRHLLDRSVGDQARQDELCDQWLLEATEDGSTIEALTVRRVVIEVPRRSGQAAPVVWEREVATCGR